MIKKPLAAMAFAAGILGTGTAFADDTGQPVTLEPVKVTETAEPGAFTSAQIANPVAISPQPNSVTSITKSGIDLLGGPAQTSVYAPLDLVPSVLVESPDPYGISLSRALNIRGKDDFHITREVDGLPITGIVGGDMDLVDLENVERIDVYRAGLQANEGLGVSNASGAVDTRVLGPQDMFGVQATQALGAYDFFRTFARVDTGTLNGSGTKAFLSASGEETDKWKGAGDISRDNIMLGFNQNLGSYVKISLDGIYNRYAGDTFRGLTYAQATDGTNYNNYDYNTKLTGNAATDVNYYGFNKLEYQTSAIFADVTITDPAGGKLDIKPYYSIDTGAQYSASGTHVQIWNQDNDNAGGVIEYKIPHNSIADVTLGYWYQSMAAPPPPTDQKLYSVTPAGYLAFANWSTLASVGSFDFNSPYIQLSKDLPSDTHLTAGVRYMSLAAPNMIWYKTAGLPDVSYDQVWAYNPTPDPYAHTTAITYADFLPNVGLSQKLNDVFTADFSYSRKFGRPDWGPESSQFLGSEAAFVGKGVTLQELMSALKPELADQFDASVRYKDTNLTVTPTLFYSMHQNKEVLVTDPAIGAGISYYTSAESTTEYGAELEVAYQANPTLNFFGSGTLSSETFNQNLLSISGQTTLGLKGNQVPNDPKTMLKGGLTYIFERNLAITPVVRFVGQRYGDAANSQPVSSYYVADLTLTYDLGEHFGLNSLFAKFSITNILDRHYIGEIAEPSNLENPGSTTAYYFGAPRTFSGVVSYKF